MGAMPGPTLQQTVDQIETGLREYIEATYHIGDEAVVSQRQELLQTAGVIAQQPFLESTPRYQTGQSFSSLGLPPAAERLLTVLADARLAYDPPYLHQAEALTAVLNDDRSLVVTTGTGSGKTETFLLPVLGQLAVEAADDPDSFTEPAVRTLVLYPMNALVNDQLARLRLMLGDPDVRGFFEEFGGRPARFARYTSRTLYPGIRTSAKDGDRLRPAIRDFYLSLEEDADEGDEKARQLIETLKSTGKWPAKPDLQTWFGKEGGRWANRANLLPHDAELLTRHEVHGAPPDLLITNYSMLEYMLLRPLERSIFDQTRRWLERHPERKFTLVVDEAHLYRGASGAEVAMLIRRLCARLGVTAERLRVICTSASFQDSDRARTFAAQLTGVSERSFDVLGGTLETWPGQRPATAEETAVLAEIEVASYYGAASTDEQLSAVAPLLRIRGTNETGPASSALYDALKDFGPLALLVNMTMSEALSFDELRTILFPTATAENADRALSSLTALGSIARPSEDAAGLLPCRVHVFFRGLPGLWACPDVAFHAPAPSSAPIGKLFPQPRDTCDCGARVYEYYTCRGCGSSYLRGYVQNIADPTFVHQEAGATFRSIDGDEFELTAIDLLLDEPTDGGGGRWGDLDLVTGRLNPEGDPIRMRSVFLPPVPDDGSRPRERAGEFNPCGVCQSAGSYGRTSVQDHQTKGDQPFQTVVARQLASQPPGNVADPEFAPLRGRKVLLFSDSRQMAARLAPNIQKYSAADVVRPALALGWQELEGNPTVASRLNLEDSYLALVLGAQRLNLRLVAETSVSQPFRLPNRVAEILNAPDADYLDLLLEGRSEHCPKSLLLHLFNAFCDNYYGLPSLGLGTLTMKNDKLTVVEALPEIPGVAESLETKRHLVEYWLGLWTNYGIWFGDMDASWVSGSRRSGSVSSTTGKFETAMKRAIGTTSTKVFQKHWLPQLLGSFCQQAGPKFQLQASNLRLDLSSGWAYCDICRSTVRPHPEPTNRCPRCTRDGLRLIDPDTDPVFVARKQYYRGPTAQALSLGQAGVMSIIAAEHTAQLNSSGKNDVFSTVERHELRFQDIELPSEQGGVRETAIDVLSCTTTMEVGIDIGSLSGVALRNMPPSRASYQQRAGRAGRRGNAIATVIAFGSSDTHDEHFFSAPAEMIRGDVVDPTLTLNNREIVRRHVTAYLLQRYHEDRLPGFDDSQPAHLFEVLGTVDDFVAGTALLNRADFETWLRSEATTLTADIDSWIPHTLETTDRAALLDSLIEDTLEAIDNALESTPTVDDQSSPPAEVLDDSDPDQPLAEVSDSDVSNHSDPDESLGEGSERRHTQRDASNLLDRLMYKGVLPRYAFPTDVASFYVFDENSDPFRHEHQYAPSQGVDVALSQYAPGKRVWIDGREWTSGAIYSPFSSERSNAWANRQLYLECSVCEYAKTVTTEELARGETTSCPACGGDETMGEAQFWIRPPGFAHPYGDDPDVSQDDQPATSYATHAKLVAPSPKNDAGWDWRAGNIRSSYQRDELLVSNTGPKKSGYDYCVACGRIEPTATPTQDLAAPHLRPAPNPGDRQCLGARRTRNLVLGTKFVTDVLIVSLSADDPVTLRPELLATQVALRTVADALSIAASRLLELEPGELKAEFRPAVSERGTQGLEAEVFLYDTLPGGAGFARRAGELGAELFTAALNLLQNCPEQCDRSCYRCLRSFKNRFEHQYLDRHAGAMLLRYCLDGVPPQLTDARRSIALDRLATDLERLAIDGVTVERNAPVQIDGLDEVEAPLLVRRAGTAITVGLHPPLSTELTDEPIRMLQEFQFELPVVPIDEMLVSRHLPGATEKILAALGVS